MSDLVLVHLYPRLLRTYGDRGNVLALVRRAEWRGFRVRVDEVGIGEPIPADANIVLLGGGTDRIQEIVGPDLLARRGELREAADRGAVVLGVCGGYQFLGTSYVLPDGRAIEGMAILDVETRASQQRLIGRIRGKGELWGESFDLVGFENHGGRTTRGPAAAPLASVPRGQGNDGRDGTEGAVQGNVVGTYLHGPVLAVNSAFSDAVLARALTPVTGGAPLTPLDDDLERRAQLEAARRPREEDRPLRRKRKLVPLSIAAIVLLAAGGTAAAAALDRDTRGVRAARHNWVAVPGPTTKSPATASSHLVRRSFVIGHSVNGHPLRAMELGAPTGEPRLLVVGCIHGNEPAGIAVARDLQTDRAPPNLHLWVVPVLNPDGVAANTRQNARGVDLNRNFPYQWRPLGHHGDLTWSGPHAISEPESRAAKRMIANVHPRVSIWFHQHENVVDESGGNAAIERRYAWLTHMRLARLTRYPGSATGWENHAMHGTTAFVVELPAGTLSPKSVEVFSDAILRLLL